MRITAIYEGANGIHARALSTRGLHHGTGADDFAAFVHEIAGQDLDVARHLAPWEKVREHMRGTADPLPLADEFTQMTVQLFFDSAWVQLVAAAIGTPQHQAYSRLDKHRPTIRLG